MLPITRRAPWFRNPGRPGEQDTTDRLEPERLEVVPPSASTSAAIRRSPPTRPSVRSASTPRIHLRGRPRRR